jgi:PAS domain S-box-containing protein
MGGGRRILIVENDLVILEAVADMLSAKNYQVTKARNGLEALEYFRTTRFDVAILDIVVPKIDGHELCRLIRQDPRGRMLPIIAFTALGPQDVAKLPGFSPDAYVAKGPLTVIFPNLLDAIKAVMAKRRGKSSEQRIFGYDVFRPRRIVSELFTQMQYYQRLVHATAELVIELDPHGKILSANPAALRLVGRPEAELTGSAFADLLSRRDRTAFHEFSTLAAKDPVGAAGPISVTLAGSRRRLWCQPVIDNGEIIAFLVTGRA